MDANSILHLIRVEANRALKVVNDPAAIQALEGILWISNINEDPRVAQGNKDNVIPFQQVA